MRRNSLLLLMFVGYLFFTNSAHAGRSLRDTATVLHSRTGINVFFEKLQAGAPVKIAYLGGSITAAGGYRVQTEEFIRTQYPDNKIEAVKAAVGGTGSPLGVFRLDREVLAYDPDLVFVEFAVNDGSTDSLTVCRSMEGIVRKIKRHNPKTDICFLYTINEPMVKAFMQHRLASSVRYMEQVAAYYNIPSINLGFDVYDLLMQGKLIFKGAKGVDSPGKIIFTNDGTHPTTEGHQIYTQTIKKCFEQLKHQRTSGAYVLPAVLFKDNYEYATVYAPLIFKASGGWQAVGTLPVLGRFAEAMPNLIYSDSVNDSLIIKFNGAFFGIEDIMGPSSSSVSLTVDGKDERDKLRFDKSCTNYRRSYFYLDSLGDGEHTVVIKVAANHTEKLKVLNAIHREGDKKYSSHTIYVGNVLLLKQQKADPDFHIYLLMGQSNMAGRGKLTPENVVDTNLRILMLNKLGEWVIARHPLHYDKPAAGVGPGLAFAKEMIDAGDNNIRIGLVPCAVGGSRIEDWEPGAANRPTRTHPYDDALLRIKEAMQAGVIKGVLWHQGESNSAVNQSDYLPALIKLIERVRLEVNDPDLPFIAGELGRFKDAYLTINKELNKLPGSLKNTGVVSSDGLIDKGDKTHFDNESAALLGKRYAAEMMKLQRVNK